MALVTFEDIQLGTPRIVDVSATAAQLSASRLGASARKIFYIVPLTAGVIVTISPVEQTATALKGFVLTQYQPYIEARSAGYEPYQGAWQVVASGAGQISVVEVFDK
jgi:hypothetical protein